MPDFGAPVADQIQTNPNQVMQNLNGLMGLAQARQNLQIGQQQLQVGQGQAQQAQQQMQERQLLQQAMASGKAPDGTPLKGPDGEVDPVALAKFANTSLPLTGQNVMQSIIKTQQDRLHLNDAVRTLGQNYRNDISGVVRSAIGTNQGPDQINAALDAYGKQNAEAEPAITRAQSLIQNLSPDMPQAARDQALQHLAMEFQPATTTEATQRPQNETFVAPGGQLGHYQSNQYAPGGPGQYGQTPQMGYAPALGTATDAAGNLIHYNTETPGSAGLIGHGGAPEAQNAGAPQEQPGKFGTPSTILNGLRQVESGGANGDPYAVNAKTGAMGPYQFTPSTIAMLAKQGIRFDPFDPDQSRNAADYYMAQLLKQSGGDYSKALAAYGGFKNADASKYIAQVESGGSGAGSYQPPVMSLGEPDVIRQNTQTINQNRLMAANAQTELNVLDHITALAKTPNLYLGPGSESVGKLATAVAAIPGMEGAKNYATNYNELAKFMAQNAVRMGKQIGLAGSDSRIDLAMHQNPNAEIGPQAILGIAQYQQSLVHMAVAKANAMDKWLQQPGNSLQNEDKFEQMWRNNADPRLFQIHGFDDQNAAASYAKSHISTTEQKTLAQKYQALQQLGVF